MDLPGGAVVKTLFPLWRAGGFLGKRTYDPWLGN